MHQTTVLPSVTPSPIFSQKTIYGCYWKTYWSLGIHTDSAFKTLMFRQPINSPLLSNPEVHHRIHKSSSVDPILSQMKPSHIQTPNFLNIHCIFLSHRRLPSVSSGFPTNISYTLLVSSIHATSLAHLTLLYVPQLNKQTVQLPYQTRVVLTRATHATSGPGPVHTPLATLQ